jgi:hypothetical protein
MQLFRYSLGISSPTALAMTAVRPYPASAWGFYIIQDAQLAIGLHQHSCKRVPGTHMNMLTCCCLQHSPWPS